MRKVRNMVALFLLTVIMLASIVSARAAARRTRVFSWDDSCYFAADGFDIWLADRDGLWRSKRSTNPVLLLEKEDITAVDARDSVGYIAYQDGIDQYIAEVSADGVLLQEWLVQADGAVRAICALESRIVMLTGRDMESKMLILDRKTGAMTVPDGLESLSVIAAAGENSVIVSCPAYGALYTLDAATGEYSQMQIDGLYPIAMHRLEDGTLRLLTGDISFMRIIEIAPNGERTEIGEIDWEAIRFGADMTEDCIYLQLDETFYRFDISDFPRDVRTQTITIGKSPVISSDARMQEAIRMFKQRNPDVGVKMQTAESGSLELELMSGQADYDVFLLQTSNTMLNMERSGLFADLGAYPQITTELKNWIDIGMMYDSQGRLIRLAYEAWLFYQPELIEPMLLKRTGLEIPQGGMTYDEFRILAMRAREQGVYLYAMYPGMRGVMQLYHALYTDPVNGDLDYDTPEFRNMLAFWKRMYEEDLVLIPRTMEEADAPRTDVLFCEGGEMFFVPYRAVPAEMDMSAKMWMYMPTADGAKAVGGNGCFLYLYEYSSRKELGADFLACYASVQAQSMEREGNDLYLQDLTQYKNYSVWTTPVKMSYSARPDLGTVMEQAVYPQQHVFEMERLANSKLTPNVGTDISNACAVLLPEYLEGNIALDEVVAQLCKKADIWLNE